MQGALRALVQSPMQLHGRWFYRSRKVMNFNRRVSIMRRIEAGLLAVFGLLLLAVPALAHHSFTAEFDILKPTTISGTITKTDWINPHIHMFINVKDDKGNIVPWDIETWGTGNAHRGGLTREKIAPGTPVKVLDYRAK